ncbi:MAG TPA: formate dehydrogenase [bacterium]|nr:formate dehydrogenase [bacterium]
MASSAILFDSSKCTACKGCQVACKTWNQDKFEKTANSGSNQNPPALSPLTRTIIRFNETDVDDTNKIIWTFLKDSCRHCVTPPCEAYANEVCNVSDAVRITDYGAVVYTANSAKVKDLGDACPYGVPKQEKPGAPYVKCTMCFDRISNGLKPACVTACPPNALEFGPRDEIIKLAKERLAKIKDRYPDAHLHDDYEDVSVIYLLTHKNETYQNLVCADHGKIRTVSRRDFLKQIKLARRITNMLNV